MRKVIFGFISILIILIIIIIGCEIRYQMPSVMYKNHNYQSYQGNKKNLSKAKKNRIEDEDFLGTYGTSIVNQSGKEVVLEGVNIGGWLLQEYWMCPVKGDKDVNQWTNIETLQELEKRFGEEKTRELVETYEENWITEKDIQNIAAKGCNVIRVPFWFRNFMLYSDGTWIVQDKEKNPGFQRLDWIIKTAGKYGIYVILDMHGCPGGQSSDHSTGSARKCRLYSNETHQKSMEKLWVAIAKRYKDNPTVAAYDIMNEPEYFEGKISEDPRNKIYDQMIHAIREVDNRHIIAVEGIWELSVLPHPDEIGWTNVIYEVHSYGDNVDSYCKKLLKYSNEYDVPVYLGEFSDVKWLEKCREEEISFTSWTYKGTSNTDETWFMYQSKDMAKADVTKDPYWLIKLKWGKCLRTEYFDENKEITKYWKQN